MLVNLLGKTDLVASLDVGEKFVWVIPRGRLASKEMSQFSATAARFNMRISQKKGLIAAHGEVSVDVLIVERVG